MDETSPWGKDERQGAARKLQPRTPVTLTAAGKSSSTEELVLSPARHCELSSALATRSILYDIPYRAIRYRTANFT